MTTGKDMTEALRRMMGEDSSTNVVPVAKPRGAAAEQKSAAPLPGAGGKGGAIASPLTETAYTDREWFAETAIASTDGLFQLKIKRLKKVKFTDANSNTVLIEYKAPI